ncbi:MAG: putative manganese-dependent inorganic diphosphatase, partial [Firmicutes bacterium]|nr:putative manganese-dependent inorganic diphosphatase [Bacillota bacterium]
LSNREDSQLAAIEKGAGALVICLGAEPSQKVTEKARAAGCAIISTPFDTYKASYFINQSVPVSHYMKTGKLQYFHLDDPIEEVLSDIAASRHVYFPVLDGAGSYCGMVTRRNMIAFRKKKLILVDHNESTQCVPGWKTAEILEIIDHHRVGGLQTINPIFFRNQPVGSTSTIIYSLYKEFDLEPEPSIAGALCCAILSDTLKFKSPTVTPLDETAARRLAELAGEDIDDLARQMFEAGENLEGKTPHDLLHQDYKEFSAFGTHFGAGQISFFSDHAMQTAAEMLRPHLHEKVANDGLTFVYMMLTNIEKQDSLVLYAGVNAQAVLQSAFPDAQPFGPGYLLKGVVSRKKQLIPQLLEALSMQDEAK